MPTDPAVLKVSELASLLRCGRRQAYELVRSGQVPGVIRLGRSIRISRHAVEVWLHDGAAAGGTTDGTDGDRSNTDTLEEVPAWKAPPQS